MTVRPAGELVTCYLFSFRLSYSAESSRRQGAGAEPGENGGRPVDRLRSHFGIESFYCRPGIEGAHEKAVFHDRARRLLSVNYRIVVVSTTLAELTRQ